MGVKKAAKKIVAAAKKKFSPAEIKRLTAAVQAASAQHRKSVKPGEQFQEIEPEDIVKKLHRVNSPFINSQSFTGSVPPGGTVTYTGTIFNPDPVEARSLYLHIFYGPGNPVNDTGTFLLNADPRLPRVTEPGGFGLVLQPGVFAQIVVQVKIPLGTEKGNYIGNAALLQLRPFNDIGKLLDRASFITTVI